MYVFNFTDAWILFGIAAAEKRGDSRYASIVSSLPALDQILPSHSEFASAYNKFLYVSFIHSDGEKTTLTAVAQQILELAQQSGGNNIRAQLEQIKKTLAAYKLKSMCNRHEWSEEQYWRGAALFNADKRS